MNKPHTRSERTRLAHAWASTAVGDVQLVAQMAYEAGWDAARAHDVNTSVDDPHGRLQAALADVGQAIESMPHTERSDAMARVLEAQGWLIPRGGAAFDFIVGVAVAAHWHRLEREGLAEEFYAMRAQIEAALALHQPRTDPAYSLVNWTYCSCGATEVRQDEDGPVIGPARYPCATHRALMGEPEATDG